MRVTFEVPGPPVPKQRPRRGKSGRWYTPVKTTRFESHVGVAAMCARPGNWPTDARYRATVALHMPDKRRRDVDNCTKSVLDGLNGVLWDDDAQVVVLTTSKRLDLNNPRTEVEVEILSTEGETWG